jgi:general secretion pathway protein G
MSLLFAHKKGFTLTEMLVTLTLLAILAAAIFPLAKNAVKREKEIELHRSLRLIREAIDVYKALADEKKIELDEEDEGYPPDLETLVEGVEVTEEGEEDEDPRTRIVKFLRRIPKDPMTNSYEWGLRSYQDDADSDVWGGENVMIKKHLNTKKKGFTLIEILIVFTLIGILVGLGIPQYKYATKRAREAVLKEDLFTLRKLINQYYTDKMKYPLSLQALVDDEYLRTIPVDPITKSSETWVEVQQTLTEDDLMSFDTEVGIVDIFSGSNEKAIDGSLYNTW